VAVAADGMHVRFGGLQINSPKTITKISPLPPSCRVNAVPGSVREPLVLVVQLSVHHPIIDVIVARNHGSITIQHRNDNVLVPNRNDNVLVPRF